MARRWNLGGNEIKYKTLRYIRMMLNGMIVLLFLLQLFYYYFNDLSDISHGFSNFMNLFPEGFIGMILILYSIKLINSLNIRKAFIFGIIGALLLGLNYLLSFNNLEINLIRFKTAIDVAFTGLFWPIFCVLYIILAYQFLYKKDIKDEAKARKTILDLGINYTRLKISEIAEKGKIMHSTIISVAKSMIEDKEIYAEYFITTNSIAFDLQANIDEIDKLMNSYKKWETEKLSKKLI